MHLMGKASSRILALEQVKRLLLEEKGTYLILKKLGICAEPHRFFFLIHDGG
jgi:hypothetical protein